MEVVYKALTRPAMIFGVPITPFFIACAIICLTSLYTNLIFLSFLPVVIFIMKEITKKDDFIFKLIFLKISFFTNPSSKKFSSGKKAYITNQYSNNRHINFNMPKLSIIGLDKVPNISKYLPYQTLANNVVITKNFDIMATWHINGISFEVENENFIEFNKQKINMFLRQFDAKNVSFYIHSVRTNTWDKFDGIFKNEFLSNLNKKYYDGFSKNDLKNNSFYLTAIYSPLTTKALRSSFIKDSLDKRVKELNNFIRTFENFAITIESNFNDFGIKRLKNYEIKGQKYSEQLEFYNFLISGEFQKVRTPNAPIYEYLTGNLTDIMFGNSTAQLNYNDGRKKFIKAIEIKDYPSESFSGIFDLLMYEDIEYIMTQSFVPMPKVEAKGNIDKQRKRLVAAEDDAISQIEELDTALDNLVSGELNFGKYHLSLVVFGDSVSEVEKNANKIMKPLGDLGFLTTLASIALPATYFSQFPANFGIRPRIHTLSTLNFASLVSFHNFAKGKRNNNQWGDAVTIFKTPNKQPFYFNFHETRKNKKDFSSDTFLLANTLIIGKSGGGKTVLMGFLLDQLQKYADKNTFAPGTPEDKKNATFFFLDKDKGASANIFASGGKYLTIDAGKPTGFNPFMVDNTAENIRKLQTLMKMLVTRNNEILTTLEEESLNNAVTYVMHRFEKDERNYGISLMLEHLTERNDERNSLKSRLKLWSQDNKFGWVFDNEIDELNFNDTDVNIYGIDGTDLLKDSEINCMVAYYILWRIMDLTDGRRFGLLVDEAWDWIQNEIVAKEVFNKQKTIRKQNGFVVLGTQSVEDFAKSKIATAVIEQSATILLLANPQAKKVDYVDRLNLSEEEFEFVKKVDPNKYKFLVRKNTGEKSIVSLDLSSVGKENLAILSTGSTFVDEVEKIINDKSKNYDEKLENLKNLYRS